MKRTELPPCTIALFQGMLKQLLCAVSIECAQTVYRCAVSYINELYVLRTIGNAQWEAMISLLIAAWGTVEQKLQSASIVEGINR